jgi:ribosome hibernation promoting factor
MSKAIAGKNGWAASAPAAQVTRKAKTPPVVVTVTFRHLAPTDAIRTYAERKFSHVAKFLKRTCEVHLILTVDKYRQQGEVTVKSGRLLVTALEETHDLYSVIDSLADKVGRQLKSQLGKSKAKRLRAPSTGKVLTVAEDPTSVSRINRA